MVFKYQPRSAESIQRQAEQKGSNREGIFKPAIKQYRMRDGQNALRILPPTWEDAEHYGYKIYVHFGVGPQGASVICPAHYNKKKCPICEAQKRADDAGDSELAKALLPKKRYVMWILDRFDEKSESLGPQIVQIPWTLDRDIAKVSRDRRTGKLYHLDDPENGFEVYFDREGKGGGKGEFVQYTGANLSREPSGVDDAIIDHIVKMPVPETLLHRTYDEIKTLFEGGDSGEAEAPAKNPNFRGAGRRPDPEPEQDSQDVEGPPEAASGDSDVEDEVPFEKYEGEQRQSREGTKPSSNVDALREKFARNREQK